ncbi:hypothetical protein CVT24_004711, partial [Panaeolus cyanescens]
MSSDMSISSASSNTSLSPVPAASTTPALTRSGSPSGESVKIEDNTTTPLSPINEEQTYDKPTSQNNTLIMPTTFNPELDILNRPITYEEFVNIVQTDNDYTMLRWIATTDHAEKLQIYNAEMKMLRDQWKAILRRRETLWAQGQETFKAFCLESFSNITTRKNLIEYIHRMRNKFSATQWAGGDSCNSLFNFSKNTPDMEPFDFFNMNVVSQPPNLETI